MSRDERGRSGPASATPAATPTSLASESDAESDAENEGDGPDPSEQYPMLRPLDAYPMDLRDGNGALSKVLVLSDPSGIAPSTVKLPPAGRRGDRALRWHADSRADLCRLQQAVSIAAQLGRAQRTPTAAR